MFKNKNKLVFKRAIIMKTYLAVVKKRGLKNQTSFIVISTPSLVFLTRIGKPLLSNVL